MKKKKKKLFLDLAEKYREKPVIPVCSHFNTCGGCMFQDISYENQLLLKKEYINTIMQGNAIIDTIFESKPFHYRNRMDMVTAFGKIGLRQRGNYKNVIDIESCEIMQGKSNNLFQKARTLLKNVEDYNYLNHKGYLRYVVLRQAMFSEQVMLNLVVADRENRLHDIIKCLVDDVDSLSIILSDGIADLSFGEIIEDIKGGYIEEFFDTIKYRITPNSFFQSNSYIALEIYKKIRNEVKGRVLDLYSGIGSISLFIAENAEHVTGIELINEAVEIATINKDINKINNVTFICQDAKTFIRENKNSYDTLILDPPRSGMNPKMLKYINEMAPERIIYMSCNPVTFRYDVSELKNYSIEKFEAFDMFPQTPHLETLAILKKNYTA